MKHDNQIAVKILRHEYADYEYNSHHYDQEYKMLIEAQEQALAIAGVVATEGELACGTCGKPFTPIDKWNYHCQSCQPCKPLEQDN